jgi:SAM-dependent methyltransferase
VTETPPSGPAWLNVGCGTHLAPTPWWNVDVVDKDHIDGYGPIHPDEVVPRGPLPYADHTVSRVMLSHVLEHIDWGQPILDFLRDIHRVLKPGGEVLAIGPDVFRTLERWRAGQEPWEILESNLEHARNRDDLDGPWPEARHHWNCTEVRIVMALDAAGFTGITPIPVPSPGLDDWPVVGPAPWQCAAKAVA